MFDFHVSSIANVTFVFDSSPSGWDNESKINILLENSATIKSDSDFADIIPKPSMQRKPVQRDVETINAVEDQEFLAKLQILLNKTSSTTPKAVKRV